MFSNRQLTFFGFGLLAVVPKRVLSEWLKDRRPMVRSCSPSISLVINLSVKNGPGMLLYANKSARHWSTPATRSFPPSAPPFTRVSRLPGDIWGTKCQLSDAWRAATRSRLSQREERVYSRSMKNFCQMWFSYWMMSLRRIMFNSVRNFLIS